MPSSDPLIHYTYPTPLPTNTVISFGTPTTDTNVFDSANTTDSATVNSARVSISLIKYYSYALLAAFLIIVLM